MKLTFIVLLFVTSIVNVFAQSPEKMSYQAIIRLQDNTLAINSNINLKIVIHQGSISGTTVYQENHSIRTNSNGLVTLEIGTGKNLNGNFDKIAWEKGPYFIETQVDLAGGTNYNIIGNTQLLSVPYALHAKTAENLVSSKGAFSYKAKINSLATSRNISTLDINNTIECTKSSILLLTSGFNSMEVGDVINLEAHNGALLTIQAIEGVSINYIKNGIAKFTSIAGNVRFGFLRKISENAYIISGQ
ncbi:hypothetical protein RCH18_002541 [Flavobacterium sp. PL11]|uniref:hypothetical protein n=1 Tax=Flavobacterium sp. PL11 TaxID=3071717 RepID=UPI002E09F75D|nr:hypothetical protein [Flavobacterium sp. PL11]